MLVSNILLKPAGQDGAITGTAWCMTTLGWSALGSLITKVIAQSATLPETLSYTTAAIAVCGIFAAVLAAPRLKDSEEAHHKTDDDVEMLKQLAAQARFADTRVRLLGLADRFTEKPC
jgi:hypothetical protein